MPTPQRKPKPANDPELAQEANEIVDRLQDIVARQLPAENDLSPDEAYEEIIAELETAPEIDSIRHAVGRDPDHFGSED